MKRGATRQEIILATQDLITRNGIRAVRVDEIAQALGISKRTLYEMFDDKNDLMNTCLQAMSLRQRARVTACCKRRRGSPLQRVFLLANEYIDGLCHVDSTFLADIRRRVVFADHFDENHAYWCDEMQRHLSACLDAELLLDDVDTQALARQIVTSLFELRLHNASREELFIFCRTLLRGAATRAGIECIDRK